MSSEDDLLQNLPSHDLGPNKAEQIRRRAHVILQRQRHGLAHPARARASNWYHQVIEPAVLIGMGLTYLVWMVHDTVALFH